MRNQELSRELNKIWDRLEKIESQLVKPLVVLNKKQGVITKVEELEVKVPQPKAIVKIEEPKKYAGSQKLKEEMKIEEISEKIKEEVDKKIMEEVENGTN